MAIETNDDPSSTTTFDTAGGRLVSADEATEILVAEKGFRTRFAVSESSLTIWFDWPGNERKFIVERAILDMGDMSVMLVSQSGWGVTLHDSFNVDEWIRDNVRCDEARIVDVVASVETHYGIPLVATVPLGSIRSKARKKGARA